MTSQRRAMGKESLSHGLRWVRTEVDHNLNAVARLVEEYSEAHKKNPDLLYKALAHVQEVRGVAVLVRAFGLVLVAEEMRQTLDDITAGRIKELDPAYSALVSAAVQASDYLDLLEKGGSQSAIVMQPVVNELRLARNKAILTEDDMFVAQYRALGIRLPHVALAGDHDELQGQAKRLGPVFTASLAAWIKEQDEKQAISRLGRISELLAEASSNTEMHQLWRAGAACVEALLSDGLESSLELKRQFGRAGQLIKIIVKDGEADAVRRMSDVALRLLYFVGRATSEGPRVLALRDALDLARWVPTPQEVTDARTHLRGANTELLARVAEELRAELAEVRVSIDMALRSGAAHAEQQETAQRLKAVADTLNVLGLTTESEALGESLQALEDGSNPDQAAWLECATSLLQVDLSLEGALYSQLQAGRQRGLPAEVAPQPMSIADLRAGTDAVLRESLVDLARVKTSVEEFFRKRDRTGLPDSAQQLNTIGAGLRVLGLTRAEHLVSAACQILQSDGFSAIASDPTRANRFAEAISGIEYYVELRRDQSVAAETVLGLVEDIIESFGDIGSIVAVPDDTAVEDPQVEDVTAPAEFELALVDESVAIKPETVSGPAPTDLPGHVEKPEYRLPGDETAASPDAPADAPETQGLEWVEPQGADDAFPGADAAQGVSDGVPIAAALPADPDVDPEIRDIFIEEAGEVLDTLRTALPGWQKRSDDFAILGTIRRGFHTLKGSGRMVKAEAFGEFAWAIENLLNRCLDHAIPVTPELMTVVERAIELVPEMITAFKEERVSPELSIELAEQANAIAAPEDDKDQDLDAIFRTDAQARLQMVLRWVSDLRSDQAEHPIPEPVVRAFHTLRGSAFAINADAIGQLSAAIEDYLLARQKTGGTLPQAAAKVLDECCTELDHWIGRYSRDKASPQDLAAWLGKLSALDAGGESADGKEEEQLSDVFAFETLDLLQKFEQDLDTWSQSPSRTGIVRNLASNAESIKGAAAIAGCAPIAAIAQSLRLRLDDIAAGAHPGEGFFEALGRVVEGMYGLLDQYRAGQLEGDGSEWVDRIMQLEVLADAVPGSVAHQPVAFAEGIGPQEAELLYTFLGEAGELLEKLDEQSPMISRRPDDRFVQGEWLRALHTLKGSAHLSGLTDIGQLAHRLEDATSAAQSADGAGLELFRSQVRTGVDGLHELVDLAKAQRLEAGASVLARFDALSAGGDAPELDVELPDAELLDDTPPKSTFESTGETLGLPEPEPGEEFVSGPSPEPVVEPFVAPGPELEAVQDDADPELVEIFTPEGLELTDALQQSLAEWRDQPSDARHVAEMQRLLHTFKGGARMAGLNRLGEAAHALETRLVPLERNIGAISAGDLASIGQELDALQQMFERGPVAPSVPGTAEAAAETASAPDPDGVEPAFQEEDESIDLAPYSLDQIVDARDPELAEIFAPEAQELLDALQQQMAAWREQPEGSSQIIEIQRLLHTFKGGARMSGLNRLGEAAHILETRLLEIERVGPSGDPAALAAVGVQLDALHQLYEATVSTGPSAAGDLPEVDAEAHDAPPDADGAVPHRAPEESEEPATGTLDAPTEWDPRLFWRPEGEAATPSEMRREAVRVPVERLDAMLNQAGEIAIYHSRLEENHATLGTSLTEMEQTITRMREQLRMMEVETEAQIAARGFSRASEEDRYEAEFDALEMDRYSRMQELSRALAESVSDLASLHGTLSHSGSEAEVLLQQQGRINNEVQQGLMGTLMVPFSRQVQRLSRVVRQTAEQNGKAARAEFSGADSEMDRNVLERMTAPLEHLLRNCVVHGIEDPETRSQSGKPEVGVVTISLKREGSQLLVEVRDDGKGLDFGAIRANAVKRGLMREDAVVSDEDLARFVFTPGFSTAKSLTQDAGRGIGMDVVAAEVKQLGGTVDLTSVTGKGARFSIRLPLMLAVSQALVVQVGEEFFAVPLGSVEGIARAPRAELDQMIVEDGKPLEYAGNHYQVRSLSELVGLAPGTRSEARTVPAILMRIGSAVGGAERRIAVVADHLVGNREIVTKAAGPVLGSVAGVTGATLMADGRVMLILDVPALIQESVRRRLGDEAAATHPATEESPHTIMVVDDSITIRRVTERLLTRKGYNVVTARDGVDAMSVLQSETPDAILLDIEMPRADGFEVAAFIRNTPRLGRMPILMITSRSGDKHREHARQIGVDRYLIKPFQEEQLLSELRDVLAEQGQDA